MSPPPNHVRPGDPCEPDALPLFLSRRSRRHAWISGTGAHSVWSWSRTEEREKSHSWNVEEIVLVWTIGTSSRGPKRQALGVGAASTDHSDGAKALTDVNQFFS
ncbi:uncharacterized protein LOC144044927 [Vanacampus margaritifer]